MMGGVSTRILGISNINTHFIPKKISTMVENVDDEVAYDRKPCGKDKDDRILVNRLIKGLCEFPQDIN